MKLAKTDFVLMLGALNDAIDWQESLADANKGMPQGKTCLSQAGKYKKLQTRLRAHLKLKANLIFEECRPVSLKDIVLNR